ncbi:MAG: septum formation initiator family protein [Lachnospiraceae bacterium]|nr:septum formation initiator family protein [Lachnospiraceae bacterium]
MAARAIDRISYRSAAPAYQPETIRRSKQAYVDGAREKVEEKVGAKRAARRALTFSQGLIITVCTALVLSAAVFYVVGLSKNHEIKAGIGSLKAQIQVLEKENALLEQKIEERTDYEAIRVYATQTLGMRLPEKQQVVSYERGASDYVEKKADIPNE